MCQWLFCGAEDVWAYFLARLDFDKLDNSLKKALIMKKFIAEVISIHARLGTGAVVFEMGLKVSVI